MQQRPYSGKFSKELAAKWIVSVLGSWWFAGGQSLFFAIWMIGNAYGLFHFDPPPWLKMNIIMSVEAAYATCFILIAAKHADRYHAQQQKYMSDLLESQVNQNKVIIELLQYGYQKSNQEA